MKMLSKSIVFFVGMLFVGVSANAQDYGRLLHSGTYGVSSLSEFMGSSSWVNWGNYDIKVYENAIVFMNMNNGKISYLYLYKGQSDDGGRLYRFWDIVEGREGNGIIVYNNGTFYRTDGMQKYEKGGSAPAPSQQYNGYNNSGNYNNGSNSNQQDRTCVSCHGDGKCSSCAGRGQKQNIYNHQYYDCTICQGSGKCQHCYGLGWR